MMKTFLLLLTLLSSLYAEHISWRSDYEKALVEAKKEHKVLMVLVVKNNCSNCNRLIKESFINQTYINELQNKTIAVIVNSQSSANYPRELFYTTHYPSLFFVDTQTELFLQKPLHYPLKTKEIQRVLREF